VVRPSPRNGPSLLYWPGLPKLLHASLALALSTHVTALAGCGGGGDDFPVTGTSGTSVNASFPGWVPEIHAGIGAEDHLMLVDTGAPITICDTTAFPSFTKDGKHDVDWNAFGLGFPGYEVVSYDIFAQPPGPGVDDGLVGGTLLSHFAVRFDYQGGHAALFFDQDPPAGDPATVAPGIELPFDLLGGGLSYVPGRCPPDPYCGTTALPATRIVLPARFEGQSETQWIMVDSGASAIATSESFIASLAGNGGVRPRLDGVAITTATGVVQAAITRVWRAEVGDGATTVALDDLPVLVLPTDDLLNAISKEVKRPIVALVGGTFLREFQATIDYPDQRLTLEKYRSRAHIPSAEYVGVGFTLQSTSTGTWLVGDVYTGSDAAMKGLASGQTVEELEHTPITGLPRESVNALFDGHALGTTIAVGVLDGGTVVTKDVAIEDLLPSYGAP
jgi:hypothetical protein